MKYICNDPNYNEFPQSFHREALLYAKRKIARKYGLLARRYVFTCYAKDEAEKKNPVDLKIHSFDAESGIIINGNEYKRADNLRFVDDPALKQYQLYFGTQNYQFNYIPRSEADEVQLFYLADITVDDYDDESITPLVPEKYEDELLRKGLIYIAEAGISKFIGTISEKYLKIFRINSGKRVDTKLGEKQSWPDIKVFKVI